jgi:hypothetical protein
MGILADNGGIGLLQGNRRWDFCIVSVPPARFWIYTSVLRLHSVYVNGERENTAEERPSLPTHEKGGI